MLLAEGAHVDAKSGKFQLTALFVAARSGHIECVKLLVKKNAAIELVSAEKATPLYVAVCP